MSNLKCTINGYWECSGASIGSDVDNLSREAYNVLSAYHPGVGDNFGVRLEPILGTPYFRMIPMNLGSQGQHMWSPVAQHIMKHAEFKESTSVSGERLLYIHNLSNIPTPARGSQLPVDWELAGWVIYRRLYRQRTESDPDPDNIEAFVDRLYWRESVTAASETVIRYHESGWTWA